MIARLKKKFPRLRIRLQTLILLIGISAATLVMIAFYLLFTRDLFDFVQTKSTESYVRQTEMLADRMDYSLSKVRKYAELMRTDGALQQAVLEYSRAVRVTDRYEAQTQAIKALQKYSWMQNDVHGAYIVTPHGALSVGNSIFAVENIQSVSRYLSMDVAGLSESVTLCRFRQDVAYRAHESLFSGMLVMLSPLRDGDRLAAVYMIVLSENFLSRQLDRQKQCLVTLNGEVVYGEGSEPLPLTQETGVTVSQPEGGMVRRFQKRLSGAPMALTLTEDLDMMYASVRFIRSTLIVALLLCVCVGYVSARRIFAHMIAPIHALHERVSAHRAGKDAPPPPQGAEEKPGRRFSLQTRLLAFLGLTFLLPTLLFLGIYYVTAYSGIRDVFVNANQNMIQISADGLDLALEEQQDMMQTLIYNRTLAEGDDYDLLEENYLGISRLWNTNMNLLAGRDDRLLFASNVLLGQLIGGERKPLDERVSQLSPVEGLSMKSYVAVWYVRPATKAGTSWFVNLMDNDSLMESFANTPFEVLVCNADDVVIASTRPARIGQAFGEEERRETGYSRPTALFGLTLHYMYDTSSLVRDTLGILFQRIYHLLILFLTLFIGFDRLCQLLLRPLVHIRGLMDSQQLMEIDELYQHDSIVTEVDALGDSFNEMKRRIDELMDDLMLTRLQRYQVEIERRDAELLSLQSQIHPHFLCNLLESICCLNTVGRYEEANAMLRDLGDLFRYSLSRENPLVTVAEELAYTQAYGNILQKKYERIRFVWLVDEAARERPVLRLLIQPLVENAVLHGLADRKDGGTVRVTICNRPDGVEAEVADDGAGMEPEHVREGVGLKNVRKRIQLYYGDQGRFEIESAPGRGATVRLFLPEQVANAGLTDGRDGPS